MVTRSIPKRIEAWFRLSPDVVLDINEVVGGESGVVEPDRGVVIGCRSTYGAEPEYGNGFHEMAHMIDIDDRRVRQPGWGLKFGKWVSFASSYSSGCYEMQTDAGIRREVRVMAIQAVITEHCGFNFDYLNWAHLLSSGAVPNYCIWRNKLGLEYEDEKDGYLDDEDSTTEPSTTTTIDAGILRSMRSELSIEPLWAEWVRKAKVVDRQIRRARSRAA